MQRPQRSDSLDPITPRGLRSVGSSSDVLSQSARSTRGVLPPANPPPAYVAESAAENLLYAEIEVPVKISPAALSLVNAFLDQILYDILQKAHSTTLAALRAAVPVALKQRLGRAAVKAADEELQDYLDEEELAELQSSAGVLDPKSNFDLDLTWTLTRLRCMVYAKLGDLEEEDEEDFLDDEDLRYHVAQVKSEMRASANISPASAIFLTTILEFLGEQSLCIAAQHARRRRHNSRNLGQNQFNDDTITLDEIDMSGIGKEGPLIRLWRSWKGSVRGSISSRPTTPNIMSPAGQDSPTFEWRSPTAGQFSTIQEERSPSVQPASEPLETPLPDTLAVDHLDEAEGAKASLDRPNKEASSIRPELDSRRPSSMLLMPGKFPTSSIQVNADEDRERPHLLHTRSRSLPNSPPTSEFITSTQPHGVDQVHHGSATAPEETEDEATEDESVARQDPRQGAVYSARSSAMDATVATIAGALSVEASRGLRRDQPSQQALRPQSSRDDTRDIESADGDAHGPDNVPVDEAFDPANPRDSGFGVDAPDNVEANQFSQALEAEPNQPVVNGPTSGNDLINGVRQPQPSPDEYGYVTIDRSSEVPNRVTQLAAGERAIDSQAATDSSLIASALSAVGTSGLLASEKETSRQSPTDVRFPQHLPMEEQPSEPQQHLGDAHEQPIRSQPTTIPTSTAPRSRSASGKELRPGTAGSSVPRKQHIRLRSDDDSATRNTPPEELDRAKKSLDLLIDSDETLHYTLTPESARAAHERSKAKAKSQTQELADFFRNTAPPGAEATPLKTSRSARDITNGLRYNPVASSQSTAPTAAPQPDGQQNSIQSKPKNPLGVPRDARTTGDTVRDLADYARSTGPENDQQLPKPLAGRPHTSQAVADRSQLEKEESGLPSNRPATTATNKSANRIKFQARDARGPRTAESSDLIDFIREGPPRTEGEHRIDRRVAPFRTTMDSDDLNYLAPPQDLEGKTRNSDGSAQESAATVKSIQSSMNSRTPLLDSSNRVSSKAVNGKHPVIEETEGLPKRTRRRVRDPYAIDFSDEEDELEEEAPQARGRPDEESLVDFLRNTAPPPGSGTKPILGATKNTTVSENKTTLTRSASSSKLRDYLHNATGGRNGHSAGTTSSAARAESPHLTQVGSKMDKYRPTQPTHAAHVDRNRQKSRIEPRDPSVAQSTGTAELAAYLKSTGPPPGSEVAPQKLLTSPSKDQVGFMKFFSRRASVRR
ncbi:hypothetical protein B0A52_00756 [Exophiala mesophila]|uniref:Uncharacterized protein n=1 Tax=Exophiala mesophila TaxID=212818 RepID=A0A438NI53_EXOME|nr:hypothetical protein B0A52_00756 [Exophiala mesophila]